eukprot:1280691-Prorocentrum_lima.AAC.1
MVTGDQCHRSCRCCPCQEGDLVVDVAHPIMGTTAIVVAVVAPAIMVIIAIMLPLSLPSR